LKLVSQRKRGKLFKAETQKARLNLL
jgi:hypothetical protein